MPKFSRIEDAVAAVAAGRLAIVVDSEDRENEGDFVGAAEKITPPMVHFMISQGRGQLCVPLLPSAARRLDLRRMVATTAPDAPAFTVPIDHRRCHTGISPADRALTIREMINPSSRAEDFARPGHVFPLIAQPRGVLARPGHTEAAVDLARLAGLKPAGVLCEICSRDGHSMAGADELRELAAQFDLPIVGIDQLIALRARSRSSRVSTLPLPTTLCG